MYKILASLTLFILVKTDNKILDLHTFSLETPEHWTHIECRGIDSYCGYIAIGQGDTLGFDYGYYSGSLEEHIPFSISNDSLFMEYRNENKNDSLNPYIYKFYGLVKDVNFEGLRKQRYYYENIGGFKAKISVPKKANDGFVGVYFERASKKNQNIRLNISGDHLDPENQKAFLEAIKTIKFTN